MGMLGFEPRSGGIPKLNHCVKLIAPFLEPPILAWLYYIPLLCAGFEPASPPREGEMIGRTTPTEHKFEDNYIYF